MTEGFIYKSKGIINKILDYLSILLFSVLFIVMLCQIFFRYVLHSPLVWSEELSRYLFVWICYLGWILATRNKTHIKIDFVINIFPKRLKFFVQVAMQLLVMIFILVLMYYGYQMMQRSINTSAVALPISFALVYGIVPISTMFILFYSILQLIEIFTKDNRL